MTRRLLLSFVALLPRLRAAQQVVRGRLRQDPSLPPAITLRDGAVVVLEADAATAGVLRDARLKDDDFEAQGRFAAPRRFVVDPIHLRALFVHRAGRRLVVTYWCAVCAVRAWTPGPCQCCQDEMALDPRDPALKDTDPSN
ncbi:MAG: hypothetical protein HY858_15160 [Candidatus Solibacter usitatus]|nr:hypothetical protein [Candidatus Solibacter usitatus]